MLKKNKYLIGESSKILGFKTFTADDINRRRKKLKKKMKRQHIIDLFNLLDLMIMEFRNVRKFEKAGRNVDTMEQRESFK